VTNRTQGFFFLLCLRLSRCASRGSYAQGEKDVSPKHLEAAAELLTLRRDVIRVIDAIERKEEDKDRNEGPAEEPKPK